MYLLILTPITVHPRIEFSLVYVAYHRMKPEQGFISNILSYQILFTPATHPAVMPTMPK